ncbi:MAG: hypothetical protein R3250_04070 [Melioribacteraceae bacterium]|nr:hypothetical protein [Melioribacteraceae bacterium]
MESIDGCFVSEDIIQAIRTHHDCMLSNLLITIEISDNSESCYRCLRPRLYDIADNMKQDKDERYGLLITRLQEYDVQYGCLK